MCGLVGIAGKIGDKERSAFKMLLQLDTVRGPHSTGVATVKNSGLVYVDKSKGTPWEFKEEHKLRFSKGKPNAFCKILIGHNRYATVGEINVANAHPFECGNVIGAHNGTLTYSHRLDDRHSFDVDSEALLSHINTYGIHKSYPDMCGAWALTWYDKKEEKVYWIRNKERPLYYAYSADEKTIFWASEEWMIDVACGYFDIELIDIIKVETDILYYIDVKDENNIEFVMETVKLKSFTPPKTASNVIYYKPKDKKKLGGQDSSEDITKASTLFNQYFNKSVGFYINFDKVKSDIIHGGIITNDWGVDDHKIRIVFKNNLEALNFLKNHPNANGWYVGKVLFTARDDSSPTGITLTIDDTSLSEPIDWTLLEVNSDIDYESFIKDGGYTTLTDYCAVFKEELAVDSFSNALEQSDTSKLYIEESINFDGVELETSLVKSIMNHGCMACSKQEEIENVSGCRLIDGFSKTYLCSSCSQDESVTYMAMSHY